jgi:hypothetical protein
MYYQNVSQEYDREIRELKEWTKANFVFNRNTVFYTTYDDVQHIGPLPESLRFPEYIDEKKKFNTPLSHLMYTLIALGEHKANAVFKQQMMDSLKANKESSEKKKTNSTTTKKSTSKKKKVEK